MYINRILQVDVSKLNDKAQKKKLAHGSTYLPKTTTKQPSTSTTLKAKGQKHIASKKEFV